MFAMEKNIIDKNEAVVKALESYKKEIDSHDAHGMSLYYRP